MSVGNGVVAAKVPVTAPLPLLPVATRAGTGVAELTVPATTGVPLELSADTAVDTAEAPLTTP